MSRLDNEQRVVGLFAAFRERAIDLASNFVDDAEAVVDEAEEIFKGMVPEMAYIDEPDHPMGYSVFMCCGSLALYLGLQKRGVDVHAYGSAVLEAMRVSPPQGPESTNENSMKEQFKALVASAQASQSKSRPGEFVFEVFAGDRSEYDWGMNVKSCAICHAFSKHGAIDLVPYMCATDDLMSDVSAQGLRRMGTIALGAHQCDFRYKSGGDPLRLVEQYPDRIHDSAKP